MAEREGDDLLGTLNNCAECRPDPGRAVAHTGDGLLFDHVYKFVADGGSVEGDMAASLPGGRTPPRAAASSTAPEATKDKLLHSSTTARSNQECRATPLDEFPVASSGEAII